MDKIVKRCSKMIDYYMGIDFTGLKTRDRAQLLGIS